jgi:hypothetical protein
VVAPLDPRLYTVTDEPLAEGRPIDYRYLYDLAREQFVHDEERGKSLDAKLAALLTGVIAAIGFSFRVNTTTVSTITALLYLVPLAVIATAYTTKQRELAPSVATLEASFPSYPVTTLVAAIAAMRIATLANAAIHSRKAIALDCALTATLLVTLFALVTQLLVVFRILHV